MTKPPKMRSYSLLTPIKGENSLPLRSFFVRRFCLSKQLNKKTRLPECLTKIFAKSICMPGNNLLILLVRWTDGAFISCPVKVLGALRSFSTRVTNIEKENAESAIEKCAEVTSGVCNGSQGYLT